MVSPRRLATWRTPSCGLRRGWWHDGDNCGASGRTGQRAAGRGTHGALDARAGDAGEGIARPDARRTRVRRAGDLLALPDVLHATDLLADQTDRRQQPDDAGRQAG